jgi:hypothetical protein
VPSFNRVFQNTFQQGAILLASLLALRKNGAVKKYPQTIKEVFSIRSGKKQHHYHPTIYTNIFLITYKAPPVL